MYNLNTLECTVYWLHGVYIVTKNVCFIGFEKYNKSDAKLCSKSDFLATRYFLLSKFSVMKPESILSCFLFATINLLDHIKSNTSCNTVRIQFRIDVKRNNFEIENKKQDKIDSGFMTENLLSKK